MKKVMPAMVNPSNDDEWLSGPYDPLFEWPQTDRITIVMEAVLQNSPSCVARLLANRAMIWNQRGPCGRKPEQVAFELGFAEVHAMLASVREKAEFSSEFAAGKVKGKLRL